MPTQDAEDQLDMAADEHADDINRQEVNRAIDEVVEQAGRVVAQAQERMHRVMPIEVVLRPDGRHLGDRAVRLIARVPHPEQGDRDEREHHHAHHSLQVDPVANVSDFLSRFPRCVQKRVERLVHRVSFFEDPALGKVRVDAIQNVTQSLHF